MKIVFLQSDPFTRTGIMSISACLKKAGHESDLLIETEEKDVFKSLEVLKPDIVGFSLVGGIEKKNINLAEQIKKKIKIPIIMGGPFATFYSDDIIKEDCVDIVCLGEGEEAIVELLDKMEKKEDITNIKNLWVKKDNEIIRNEIRDLIQDLDKLPIPDRSIYYKYDFLRNQPSKDFIFFRGCPYKCSFCFNSQFMKFYSGKGKYIRKSSVGKVIEEIKYVRDEFGLSSLMIYDDLFILDKKWLKIFLKIYKKEINLPFQCEVRADSIDEEVAKQLKEAGCTAIALGVESGNESIRNNILNKNLSDDCIINSCRLIKKYKIYLKTYNMVGIPDETIDDIFKTIEFNIKLKPDFAWCSILRIYPRTPLADYAIRKGFLDKNFKLKYFGSSYLLGDTPLEIENKNKVINLQRFFTLSVKFPFLLRLIKQLIKLPPNKLFDTIFQITYSISTIKTTKIGFKNFIKLGIKARKSMID